MAQFTISRPVGTVSTSATGVITAEFSADSWKRRYWLIAPFATVELAEAFIVEFLDWFNRKATAVEASGIRSDILKPFCIGQQRRMAFAEKADDEALGIMDRHLAADAVTVTDDDNPF